MESASPPPLGDQVVGPEQDRPSGLHHHVGRPPDGRQPVSELAGVGDGGGQGHQADVRSEVQDDLLPDRTPVRILQEVDLVEDHPAQAPGCIGP